MTIFNANHWFIRAYFTKHFDSTPYEYSSLYFELYFFKEIRYVRLRSINYKTYTVRKSMYSSLMNANGMDKIRMCTAWQTILIRRSHSLFVPTGNVPGPYTLSIVRALHLYSRSHSSSLCTAYLVIGGVTNEWWLRLIHLVTSSLITRLPVRCCYS